MQPVLVAQAEFMPLIIKKPQPSICKVLLVNAPYPGKLRFEAQPSSLLTAIGPFARKMAADGRDDELGILDPGESSEEFYEELSDSLESAPIRAVCISTSTSAIEETARIVQYVRDLAGDEVLIIAGGPHEDAVEERIASRMPGVDLSIAGQAGSVLERVLTRALKSTAPPSKVIAQLPGTKVAFGDVALSSRWWGSGGHSLRGQPAPIKEVVRRPWANKRVRFDVFDAEETLPVMVSRGCSYGRCSFCAEARLGQQRTVESFEEIRALHQWRPAAALYFQDSIFPFTPLVREILLPMLRELKVEWGCQVFLSTLSERMIRELAESGCRYLYTGLESGSAEILEGVGKGGLTPNRARERFLWLRDAGLPVGVSLMFGAISQNMRLLETEGSLCSTVDFVTDLAECGVSLAGVYTNVFTLLPGTPLASAAGTVKPVDFYKMPRTTLFSEFEDGGVGYNFTSLLGDRSPNLERIALQIESYAQIARSTSQLFRVDSAGRAAP